MQRGMHYKPEMVYTENKILRTNLLLQCLKSMLFVLELLLHVSYFSLEFINLQQSKVSHFQNGILYEYLGTALLIQLKAYSEQTVF